MNGRKDSDVLEELIVSLSPPSDPQISPNGRWVAYATTPYGKAEQHPQGAIWLAPIDGSADARKFSEGTANDTHPRWSPDGQSLAFLSDRAERGVSSLYLLPLAGGEARRLAQRKRGIHTFAWSPEGDRIAFLAPDEPTEDDERRERERDDPEIYGEGWQFNRLHLLDIASGSVTYQPISDIHLTEIAWSPDGQRIAYLAQPTPELETGGRANLAVLNLEDGESRHVCSAPGWGMHGLGWVTDGSRLIFTSSHEPLPQASYTSYAVDPAAGEPCIIGTRVDEDACNPRITVAAGAPRVVIAVAQGLGTRLEWTDPQTGNREALYAPTEGDVEGGDCRVVDGQTIIAVVQSSGSQPPEVFAGAPDALRRLSDHHAALREHQFGTQEAFAWTAPDGLPIDGILIRPPQAANGPLPLITLVHGGPYGRSSAGWQLRPLNWAQWLATHGYVILMPNYRGGTGHGNDFAKTARGNVGAGGDFSDVMAGVDAAIERGIADPDRLGIGGWSQGGFMTAWAVTQTDRFKCGVMGAGVSDWGMMSMTSDLPTFESVLGGDRPWDGAGPHRFAQVSPISFAKKARTPLLILHGKNDERVPVTQAIGFQRALRENGVEVQMVVYPREPHGVRERNHQLDILRRVRDWYDRWLKA